MVKRKLERRHTCTAAEADVLSMIKFWPGYRRS
jgi:hypothetical protein